MQKIIFIIALLLTGIAFAQDKGTIQGIVLDKEVNNEPLPFVNVLIKGSEISTTTDLDGKHILKADPGVYTLIFNFAGYEKFEITNVIVKEGEVTKLKDIPLSALSFAALKNDTAGQDSSNQLKK